MKTVKYGKNLEPINDFEILDKLKEFKGDLNYVETSSFLFLDGVRAMIKKEELDFEDVIFDIDGYEEFLKVDSDGRFYRGANIYGADLLSNFLSILIGIE